MFIVTSIFKLPLLLGIWLIDTYYILSVIRIIVANIPEYCDSSLHRRLKHLTDWLPDKVSKCVARASSASIQPWLPWIIAILALLIVRQILVQLVII